VVFERHADLEIGDTAGLETCATLEGIAMVRERQRLAKVGNLPPNRGAEDFVHKPGRSIGCRARVRLRALSTQASVARRFREVV
jgi:hypothetical protein